MSRIAVYITVTAAVIRIGINTTYAAVTFLSLNQTKAQTYFIL